MNSFETEVTLGEFGIATPDRCKTCPRLGGLATRLSTARDNRNYLANSIDEEVVAATVRANFTEKMREMYPGVTDDQIASTVENSVTTYLSGETYTRFLMQTGTLMEIEDNTISNTLGEVQNLVTNCPPPDGCGSN